MILVFPTLRTTDEVAALVLKLGSADRWQLTAPTWKSGRSRVDDELIGITWTTAEGRRSTAMGFAPFGSMPVHRRAPYVALAIWPGGHANVHWPPKREEVVSFTDMPVTAATGTPIAFDAHEKMRERTKSQVAALGEVPSEGAAKHDVSFCLHRTDAVASLIAAVRATTTSAAT